ncbi:MAG: GNAT family N-acetyltransferase [Sulfurovaceae bacterium]|nr:GNAT family N-acetyltransferase [Sulfurovaceae bacterium]
MSILHKNTRLEDLNKIVTFPEDDQETFYLFTVTETLTFDILKTFYDKRFGSTSFSLDDEVIGYANFYRYKTDPKDIIYLGNVILDSTHRGYGHSKEMVRVMESKAKEEFDANELRLAVFCDNTSAYILYLKMGFEVLRIEKRVNINNELESIFIMAKKLGEK